MGSEQNLTQAVLKYLLNKGHIILSCIACQKNQIYVLILSRLEI